MSQLAVIGRCLISRAKMRFRDEAGFNLITLSLALAFIGLLAAGILAQEKATRDAEKRQITEERLNDIEQAQDIFIERNQRLACPAAFDAAEDTEFFGRERLNTSGTYDIAEDCVIGSPPTSAGVIAVNDSSGQNTVRIGAVPVRSLNLPDDHLYDGWGNPFTYAVSANLTSSAPDPSSPGKTYYEARPGTLRLADPADNILASDIAYYVVSHGDDGTGHYSFGNTIQSQPCTGPGLDRENCNNDGIFRSFAAGASYADRNTPEIYADATTADHFDDAFRTAGKTKVTPPAINKYILDEMPCLSENAIRSDPRPNRNSPTSIRYTATSANARGENCASSAFAGHAYGDASGNLATTVNTMDGVPDTPSPGHSCTVAANSASPSSVFRNGILLYSRDETSSSEGNLTLRTTIPILYSNLYTTIHATDNDATSDPNLGGWEQAIQVALYVDSDTTDGAGPQLVAIGDLINPEHSVLDSSGSTGSVIAVAPIHKDVPYRVEIYLFCLGGGNQYVDQVSAWAGTIRLEDYAVDGYVELIEGGFQ